MSLATYATLIGVLEILIGVPLLLSPKKTMEWLKGVFDQEVLLRTISAFIAAMSVLVLLENYRIGTDVAGLVRLVAWIALIKHVSICWFPKHIVTMKDWFLRQTSMYPVWGLLVCMIGVMLIGAGRVLG
jgi:hypothetical protein